MKRALLGLALLVGCGPAVEPDYFGRYRGALYQGSASASCPETSTAVELSVDLIDLGAGKVRVRSSLSTGEGPVFTGTLGERLSGADAYTVLQARSENGANWHSLYAVADGVTLTELAWTEQIDLCNWSWEGTLSK